MPIEIDKDGTVRVITRDGGPHSMALLHHLKARLEWDSIPVEYYEPAVIHYFRQGYVAKTTNPMTLQPECANCKDAVYNHVNGRCVIAATKLEVLTLAQYLVNRVRTIT